MLLDMIPNFATDFNPRLREGGDQNDPVQNEDLRISIHASAREATNIHSHSPGWEAHFNPRLR